MPAARGDRFNPGNQVIDFRRAAVQLYDQQSFHVQGITGMHEVLSCMDRRLVHHFHTPGDNTGGDDVGHAFAALLAGRKAEQDGARGRSLAQQPDRYLGYDPQQPFGASHDPEQVVACHVRVRASEP